MEARVRLSVTMTSDGISVLLLCRCLRLPGSHYGAAERCCLGLVSPEKLDGEEREGQASQSKRQRSKSQHRESKTVL